jgi:hemoglobin
MVDRLVETFYGKVRQDERLAKLFAQDMSKDWPEHLAQMKGFWRSVVMQTSEYNGRPVPAHMKMSDIKPEDFARWLELFREAAVQTCTKGAAELFVNRAETIAKSLQMALFLRGVIAPPGAFENGVLKDGVIEKVRQEQDEWAGRPLSP